MVLAVTSIVDLCSKGLGWLDVASLLLTRQNSAHSSQANYHVGKHECHVADIDHTIYL